MEANTRLRGELESALDTLSARRRNMIIVGPPGCGKTLLLHAYVEKFKNHHSAIVFIRGRELRADHVAELMLEEIAHYGPAFSNDRSRRPLLVIDGLDEAPSDSSMRRVIDGMRGVDAQFLMASRPFSHELFDSVAAGHEFDVLRLFGFSEAELSALLERHGVPHSTSEVERLHKLSAGIPLIASLVASQLESGLLTWDRLDTSLDEFVWPGILRADGRPADLVGRESRVVMSDVAAANEDILSELKRHPERMRELTPRKFEELVAAILARQGYEVELTPASNDGGFDLYVASKESLGSFLYVVECKRFTPPNKVGVQLVRALHGVVRKTRANAGILVTSSFFTRGAANYADETMFELHLHDFLALKRWLGLL